MLKFFIAAGFIFLAFPIFAEAIKFPESAMGRINHAGFRTSGHCTGFLVESGALVTAAHCMPVQKHNLVHFLQGYSQGEFEAHYKIVKSDFRIDLARDLAIQFRLKPVKMGLPVFEINAQIGADVFIYGYSTPKQHILQMQTCKVKATNNQQLIIGCGVTQGTSGGPVLVKKDGRLYVIAVVSKSSLRQTVAVLLTAQDIR